MELGLITDCLCDCEVMLVGREEGRMAGGKRLMNAFSVDRLAQMMPTLTSNILDEGEFETFL